MRQCLVALLVLLRSILSFLFLILYSLFLKNYNIYNLGFFHSGESDVSQWCILREFFLINHAIFWSSLLRNFFVLWDTFSCFIFCVLFLKLVLVMLDLPGWLSDILIFSAFVFFFSCFLIIFSLYLSTFLLDVFVIVLIFKSSFLYSVL